MVVAISLLLVLACVVPASATLAGVPAVRESAAHSGIRRNRCPLIRRRQGVAVAAGVLVAGVGGRAGGRG
jgi:hypothetical protein